MARELVQETFINLYLHKDSLDKNTSIRAYLYVMLKNRIINHYHREIVHQQYADYVTYQQPKGEISPLDYVETRELERQLKEEIEKLPPQCKKVFKLSREQYLTDKEIAAEMDISVNTVEQHKRKALRLLRGSMGNYLEVAVIIYLLGK